ncbi:MAG TPA: hypothetical protein DCG57_08865 [Candidatus Riflebacteria bacterium]|nr:hypothetical protein [Candidatus Riflebacteria bacterium]
MHIVTACGWFFVYKINQSCGNQKRSLVMLKKSGIFLYCLFALSVAIIGCGGGGGGGNPVGPATTTGPNANLSGTVLFDNAPVPFAAVYLYKSEKAHTYGMAQLPSMKGSLAAQQIISDGAYSTTTDAAGAYSFVNIPVGQYTLIALRDENHQFVQTGVLLGQVTTINPQLTPTGKITGKVTQTIGSIVQNIAGVFVYINGTSYLAVTDNAGNFVISNVPANALTSSTAYEILVSSTLGTASSRAGVRVNPGSTTDIGTIALIAPPAANYANLSGSLVAGSNVTSAELADQFVVLTHHTDGTIFGTHTDSTGKFQFRVMKDGIYLVLCSDSDYNYSPERLIVNIVNLDNGTVTLSAITVDAAQVQSTGSIVGSVTLAGSPIAGAVVHASGTSLVGVSNSVGRFVIEKVPANTSATPYTLELSASMGTAPAKTGVVVNVGQATDAGVFAVTVPTTGYKTITGQLVAVTPVTSAMLANRLVQLTAPDGKVIAAYSDSAGAFSLITTQIGAHTFTVIDNSFDYAPRTQSISVATLDNSSQALTAINVSQSNLNVSVSGAVAWAAPPGAWTFTDGEIVLAGTSYVERRIVGAAPASYRFDNVPPGNYTLSVNPVRNGYQGSISFSVNAGVDITGQSLPTSFVAPYITATDTEPFLDNVLKIYGQQFAAAPGMQAFVNDKPLPPANTGAWTDTYCVFALTELPPGQYGVQLEKTVAGGKVEGNKVTFNRPLLPPTNVTAESTDTSITFSWENAPYVTQVNIELWQQSTQVTPVRKITGNSYTYSNLKPSTEYTIVITDYYPNMAILPNAQYSFSTKNQGLNFITARALLTAADIPDNNTIFGFEVHDNTAYIGAHGYTTGAPVTLYAVDLGNSTFVSTTIANDGLAADALYSLAVNSDGVFLTHKQTDPVLTKLNLDLTGPTSKSLISAAPAGFGLGTVSTASIRSFDNRLFLVARFASTFVGINEVNPSTLAVINPAFSVDTAKNFVDTGKSAELAYDQTTSSLYLICAETPGDATDVTTLRAFSNLNLGLTPPVLGKLDGSRRIYGASALNGQVYIASYDTSTYYETGYAVDGASGYVRELYSITCVDNDKQGRTWICTTGGDYDYFHRVEPGLNIVQSLGMPDYADPLYTLTSDLSRIRSDKQTGMMYMLHIAANGNLAAYNYNSNY